MIYFPYFLHLAKLFKKKKVKGKERNKENQREKEYQIYFKFPFLGGIAIILHCAFTLRCLSMNLLP